MRPRDVRAIAFCIVTTLSLGAVAYRLLGSNLAVLALVGAYDAWLLTRPRMQRLFRRLRGEPDWSGYYREDFRTESGKDREPVNPPAP